MNDSHRSGPSATGNTGRAGHASEAAAAGAQVAGGTAVTGVWRPSALYLLLALGLAAAGLAFWLLSPAVPSGDDGSRQLAMAPASAPPAPATGVVSMPVSKPAASVAAAPASRLPEGDADPTRDLSSYVMRGEKPTMPEVIERLHKAGIHEGLGAFSPPGTRPPMIGLAVPEDFVLPDGYVRHHQATDDGQRIEAILMFAPDRQILDGTGKPIPIPKNRVVPPEYAPPGLPIRRITLPKPLEPEGAGR